MQDPSRRYLEIGLRGFMNSVIIEAKKIVKKFTRPLDVEVLSGVDLTVHGGESVAIMGRSGEGKSTLLQILGTLEESDSGDLSIAGIPVTPANTTTIRRNRLAFVFQSYHLLEDYTVLENVLMPAKIARLPTHEGSESHKRALELLEMTGLTHRANFHTKLLSGGEKQRTAIARALCNDPDLILADEPSGNLDEETAAIIHDLLLTFAKNKGKALILVTHHLPLAEMCDRKFNLHSGLLHQF